MKKTNKILIGIIGAIILLAVVKFAMALKGSTYHTEDKPEDVAFNYLFALQHKEYERAYGYLSPDLEGYPKDVNAFIDDIRVYEGNFYGLLVLASATLKVGSVNRNGTSTNVNITIKEFYNHGILGMGYDTEELVVTLQQDIKGEWKIVNSRHYWFSCWNTPNDFGCEDENTDASTSPPISSLTFIPPSSSPVLASVQETKNYVDRKGGFLQALWESGFSSYATTFPAQDPPYQPGDILVYRIVLSETTPVLWAKDECAPTQENLDEIFSNTTIEFILDNELVSLNNFALIESTFFDGTTPCREYVAVVNHWPLGEHVFETHITYNKTIQNNVVTRLAGTYIWRYIVKVHQ